MTELMTLQEVADYLRVTRKTVYRLLEVGKIPAAKVGRQWRFGKPEIDEWLNKQMKQTKANILVVDDEEIIRALIKETLEEHGHRVECADNSYSGLELLKSQDFDLVFLDLKMAGMDGAELLREIKTIKPKLSVIVITGYPESEIMARALEQGPFGIMNKPFSESDITDCVHNFLRINQS
jgi:excisionase family DNA binding protein